MDHGQGCCVSGMLCLKRFKFIMQMLWEILSWVRSRKYEQADCSASANSLLFHTSETKTAVHTAVLQSRRYVMLKLNDLHEGHTFKGLLSYWDDDRYLLICCLFPPAMMLPDVMQVSCRTPNRCLRDFGAEFGSCFRLMNKTVLTEYCSQVLLCSIPKKGR